MTTPDQPTGMNKLHGILQKCPYRQHSPECRPFHSAMYEAEAAVQQLVERCLDTEEPVNVMVKMERERIRHNLQQAGLLRGEEVTNV